MSRYWEIGLNSDVTDLHILAECRKQAPDAHIEERDGKFYLKLPQHGGSETSTEALQRARPILESITGLMTLRFQSRTPVLPSGIVHTVDDNGGRGVYIHVPPVSFTLRALPPTITAGASVSRPGDAIFHDLQLARKDKNVQDAMRLWGKDSESWSGLYRVYEIIRADVGGDKALRNWVCGDHLGLFRRTANHQDAAGDEARHARKGDQPPSKPMPLKEARRLIETLLNRWLSEKVS